MSETANGEHREVSIEELPHNQQQANEAYQCFKELFPRKPNRIAAIKTFTILNEPYRIDLYQQALDDRGIFLVSPWWDDSDSAVPVRIETTFALEVGLDEITLSSFMFSDVTGPKMSAELRALNEEQLEMPSSERAVRMGRLEDRIDRYGAEKGENVIRLLGENEQHRTSYEDAQALIGILGYMKRLVAS